MKKFLSILSLTLALLVSGFAQVVVNPTTTLTKETANNTSAWSGYTTDVSKNAGAGNLSKISLRTLLPSGSDIVIGARLIPVWGTSYHANVGYSENDYTQVQKQVSDAMSRGVTYFSVDWYGPPNNPDSTWNDNTAQNLMKAAEATSGKFKFVLSLDKGALQYCGSGCSLTQTTTNYINYILSHYATSTAYLRTSDGRPWIYTFDPDQYGTIDWSYVRSHLSRSAVLLFRNEQGFTHAQSDGAYSWTCSGSKDSMGCLDGFYWNYTHTYYNKIGIGSTYKGFDDALASWGSGRYQDQQCGLLWLRTWNELSAYPYFQSLGHPLHQLQIATWNDYEEGHEIETGIDNCVDLKASLSGATLSWDIGTATDSSGNTLNVQPTIDHFIIFVSTDGESLMPLVTQTATTRSLDLSKYSFANGAYYFYVKAVGKPNIQNKMSQSVTYAVGLQQQSATVTISHPLDGATYSVGQNAHVLASASWSAAYMSVWYDGVKKKQVSGSSLDYWLPLGSTVGKHRITVVAGDSSGTVSTAVYINLK